MSMATTTEPSTGGVCSRLDDLVRTVRRELRFRLDDSSGDSIITVIDSETKEVVRQIPSEEVATFVARLQEAHHGSTTDLRVRSGR